jgi:hypothetical protein
MAGGPWGAGAWDTGSWGESSGDVAVLSGVSSSAELGQISQGIFVTINATGVSTEAVLGAEEAVAGNGWGSNPWNNELGWGGIISANVPVTGFELTASLGEEEAFTTVDVEVTGLSTSGSIGTLEVIPADLPSGWGTNYWGGPYGWGGLVSETVNVVGVEATTTLGVVSEVIGKVNVVLTGLQANTALGEEEVDGKANASPSGVSASGSVGNVTVFGKANINVTGVAGTVVLGQVRQATSNTVMVTGVAGTISQGSVAIRGKATVTLTGVSATGRVARPLVWGLIDTSQNPNWAPIAA